MKLVKIEECDIGQYKKDMQEAFQIGAIEGGFPVNGDVILPEKDIDNSLNKENSMAYKVMLDDKMVGGAIVVLDGQNGYLDFLYVKHGTQGKGIGTFMWFEIERQHPEIRVWETCTPYFERRNIHFYINVCGFHVVEYFSKYHPDLNTPEDYFDDSEDFGMFAFKKYSEEKKI